MSVAFLCDACSSVSLQNHITRLPVYKHQFSQTLLLACMYIHVFGVWSLFPSTSTVESWPTRSMRAVSGLEEEETASARWRYREATGVRA